MSRSRSRWRTLLGFLVFFGWCSWSRLWCFLRRDGGVKLEKNMWKGTRSLHLHLFTVAQPTSIVSFHCTKLHRFCQRKYRCIYIYLETRKKIKSHTPLLSLTNKAILTKASKLSVFSEISYKDNLRLPK